MIGPNDTNGFWAPFTIHRVENAIDEYILGKKYGTNPVIIPSKALPANWEVVFDELVDGYTKAGWLYVIKYSKDEETYFKLST